MECNLCGQVLPVGQMEMHRKRTCNQFIVKCPSDECNYEVKINYVIFHSQKIVKMLNFLRISFYHIKF